MIVGDCNVLDRWGFFRIDKLKKYFPEIHFMIESSLYRIKVVYVYP